MTYLSLEEHVESDPCKFVMASRGSSERLTLQAANMEIKQEWVQQIRELLDAQSSFLSGKKLQYPQSVVMVPLVFISGICLQSHGCNCAAIHITSPGP